MSQETVRVWLVERTYSDDEQNIIILTDATRDGRRVYRMERALTSFIGAGRVTTAAVDVERSNLGTVDDEELRERYAAGAARTATEYAPDEAI